MRPHTSAPNFEPNPPPITSVRTVTLDAGISNLPASSAAVTLTACVLAQAVILSVAVPLGGQAVRLEADVGDDREGVGGLDGRGGAGHRLVGLALGGGASLADVAPLDDLGGAFGHRLRLGDGVRQDLVVDLDRPGGVAGLLLGLGGHGGDVVALVAEGRPLLGDRQHGLDAGHLLGRRDVDRRTLAWAWGL